LIYFLTFFSGFLPSKEEEKIQEEEEKRELKETQKSMHQTVDVNDYIIGKNSNDLFSKSDKKNLKSNTTISDTHEI
jgi:hypothetical protein